ncbi:hypothetical protein BCR32DRAFT_239635 [Anaeromyces robustus]|uniref:Uncharacterized protein n=1 Tax=Anaeromyces robustus TaxID=1754192 RepID=A0A1Y1XRJ8_9FUNG|nr:hypothetical protein BCR32DRAFT_239635 [Anaeromyces robustus]|eukprot:ORX88116.1 hypothetical protein BCR32DRAFT_239635 [Anaeromyces robustus]
MEGPTLIYLNNPTNMNLYRNNNNIGNCSSSSSNTNNNHNSTLISHQPTIKRKALKPVNYIQELLIHNYKLHSEHYLYFPNYFTKLTIFPSLKKLPKAVETINAIPANKKLPLSIFYHSGKMK